MLQQEDPTVFVVDYDPFADEIQIIRHPNDADQMPIEPAVVDEAIVTAFETGAEGLGYRFEVPATIGNPEPLRDVVSESGGRIAAVTVLCEENLPISVTGDPPVVDRRMMWAEPGEVDGQAFETAWGWSCRLSPTGTTGTDRLIYSLLGLVALLGVVVIWAMSRKSDLERQLWTARNPKSQITL